ncbi:hypothetical protein EJ03DRAFT_348157 [Teratosphaeria nubilosa]|uniref:Uncharacterized protein n=1 Tax=Teratosphaeria nubilosa TaxID=161662 RepID=A0A6G1LLS0_9PEZI|nr:hypothetical protein EJ03DRAFT_348157 [Teratosphaeria nubilosa]
MDASPLQRLAGELRNLIYELVLIEPAGHHLTATSRESRHVPDNNNEHQGKKTLDQQLCSLGSWLCRIGNNAQLLRAFEVHMGSWLLELSASRPFEVACDLRETREFVKDKACSLLLSMNVQWSSKTQSSSGKSETNFRLCVENSTDSTKYILAWIQAVDNAKKEEWSKWRAWKEDVGPDSHAEFVTVTVLKVDLDICEFLVGDLIHWMKYISL